MKISLSTIINSIEPLKKLSLQELPVAISFYLSGLYQELDKHIKLFEEQRINLLKKYGSTDDQGNLFIDEANNTNTELYLQELKELLDCEVEIAYEKIKIEKLGEIKISVQDMITLKDFFTN